MNFDEIRKDYKRKIKALFKLNESYYDKNTSLISDKEYDVLFTSA